MYLVCSIALLTPSAKLQTKCFCVKGPFLVCTVSLTSSSQARWPTNKHQVTVRGFYQLQARVLEAVGLAEPVGEADDVEDSDELETAED